MVSPEELMIPGLSPTKSNRSRSTNPFDNESMGDDQVEGMPHSELTDSVGEENEVDPVRYSMRGGMISGKVIDAEAEHRASLQKDDVESGSAPPDSDYASRAPRSLWDASTVGYGTRKKPPTPSLPVPRERDDATELGKRRKYLRILVVVTTVMFALAIVAVVFLLRKPDNGDEKDSRQHAIDTILHTLSTPESLSDNGSPQYRARQWLIHHDALQLNPLANSTQTAIAQRYVLATLFYSTGGDGAWNPNNWLKGGECDVERWNFIDCDENQHVRAMMFENMGLNGELPPELGHLSHMVNFIVKDSQTLHGAIPASLGHLERLEQLGISDTQVQGTIPPEIFRATSMHYLNLQNNDLEGTIPSDIGLVSSLRKMILSDNKFTGTIPWDSLPASTLRLIALGSNQFSGKIAPSIQAFSELAFLYLEKNQLTGGIPTEIGSVGSIRSINLDHNQLSSSIPPQIGRLTGLEYLSVQYNQLSGGIPAELERLTNLKTLALGENNLIGELPDLYPLSELKNLYLFGNDLGGVVPAYVYDLDSLEVLFLSSNNFTGPLFFSTHDRPHSRLQGLYLSDNHFQGPLPMALCSFASLEAIYLDENDFIGGIPSCLSKLSHLEQLYVFNNQLGGGVPMELSTLTELEGFGIENNEIVGDVPEEVCELVQANSIELWSDCGGNDYLVSCDCCTVCCPSAECI